MFTVTKKTLKNGDTAHILTDSQGYLCGIFATEEMALNASSRVAKNIEIGKIPKSALNKNPHRQQSSQVSNKK